jgi:hypothetical protein
LRSLYVSDIGQANKPSRVVSAGSFRQIIFKVSLGLAHKRKRRTVESLFPFQSIPIRVEWPVRFDLLNYQEMPTRLFGAQTRNEALKLRRLIMCLRL